jgi:flagella basal body P-ring formation protein FlgA
MIALLLAFACLPVDGPKLLARHFAAALPEFLSLAPETDLGYAPSPGAVRVLRPDELQHLGKRHGVEITPSVPLCFEWRMATLDESRVLQAMRSSLPEDARVDLKEISRGATPPGDIVFPIEMLKAGFWRGYVRSNGSQRFDIWARVRVSVKQTRVVAATALKSADILTAAQLRLEEFESEPDNTIVSTLEQAVGRSVKFPVAVGSPLLARMLDRPAVIAKGDTVRLRATAGAAQVTAQAQAQSSGRLGEIIPVKIAVNGRVIRARVDGTGEVTWTP